MAFVSLGMNRQTRGRVNRSTLGQYDVILISPFAQLLLRWYLHGRRTNDNREIVVRLFKSAQIAAASRRTCDAVIVYEDQYPSVRRYFAACPLTIVMTRGRLLRSSGVALMDDVARAASPADLLGILPINQFVAYRGSTILSLGILGILTVIAALIWCFWIA